MEFIWDPKKSAKNERKHGIDFEEAQVLWEDPSRLEIPAKTEDEPRTMVIGKINDILWSAVITYRGKTTRIISVRRASKNEVLLYES
jgi:uncharacterized DUF497 family protein